MIDLTADQLGLVKRILAEVIPEREVRAFGSRVRWETKPHSDLDLVVMSGVESLPTERLMQLKEAFEESDLIFSVDVVDWEQISEGFRKIIERGYEVVQEAGADSEESGEGGVWGKIQLGDVLELKRGYDLPARLRVPGKAPIISSSGITGTHSEAKVAGPGVVTGRYGTIGEVFYIEEDYWPLNTTLYVRDFKGSDPKYISYFLKGLNFDAFSGKSAVPGLNRNHLHQEYVRVALKDEQPRIAEILSSLDEKIELNRKQNRTLEAIAQRLFKRWFVEFEFPDQNGQPYKSSGGAMQPSELGEIPVGWEVAKIGDVVGVLGGGTPSTKVAEYWDDGDVDWYSPTDLTKSGALFSFGSGKKITQPGLQNSSAKLFPAYSLMMTSRATIGVVSINRTPACTNQGFIILVSSEEFSLYQLHGWLLQQMPEIHSMASGSTFKEISRGTFKDFDILKAVESANFAKIVEPIYRKIETNILEIESLSQIRDTLLPKLMSGELRVA